MSKQKRLTVVRILLTGYRNFCSVEDKYTPDLSKIAEYLEIDVLKVQTVYNKLNGCA